MKVKGRGSVTYNRKNHTARVVFSTGRGLDGEYGRVPRTFYNVTSKSHAYALAEEWKRELNSGLKADRDVTFAEWSAQWLKRREAQETPRLMRSTIARDRGSLKHINRHMGPMRVADIDKEAVENLFVMLAGEGCSGHVMRQVRSKLNQTLSEAEEYGLIGSNPVRRVKSPAKPKSGRRALSADDAARLYGVVTSEPLCGQSVAVALGLAAGLRLGEACALTWGDIDTEAVTIVDGEAVRLATISVDRQYTVIDGVHGPKAGSSGTVYGDVWLRDMLCRWRDVQAYLFGRQPELVCTNRDGGRLDAAVMGKWFRRFCERNGFGRFVDDEGNVVAVHPEGGNGFDAQGRPYSRKNKRKRVPLHYEGLRFHELRHTMATRMIADGVDIKTVQAMGRWRSAQVPLDIYSHAEDSNIASAAVGYGRSLCEKNVQNFPESSENAEQMEIG